MTTSDIGFAEYVKEEWRYIVIQSFVVQKQLRQQTKILTVQLKQNRHLTFLRSKSKIRRLFEFLIP